MTRIAATVAGISAVLLPAVDATSASASGVTFGWGLSGCSPDLGQTCQIDVQTPDTTSPVTVTVNGTVIATGVPQRVTPAQPGYPAWADFTTSWTPTAIAAYTVTATQGSYTETLHIGVCPAAPFKGPGSTVDLGSVVGSAADGPSNLCHLISSGLDGGSAAAGSALPLFGLSG